MPDWVATVKPSIALVAGKNGHGSGFLALPNVVATNAHVIRDDLPHDVRVVFPNATGGDDARLEVDLLYQDIPRDLALLRLRVPVGRPPLTLAEAVPEAGSRVYGISNPGQGDGSSRLNAVATARTGEVILMRDKKFLQIFGPTRFSAIDLGPGSSGSPIFDDAGRVIGVVASGKVDAQRRPTGETFCIPAPSVKAALESLGPPEGWDDRAQKAGARHALAIAVMQASLSGEIALALLNTRVELTRDFHPVFGGSDVLARDREIITLLKDVDRQLQTLASPAVKVISGGKVAPVEWQTLMAIQEKANSIRTRAGKPRVTPIEHKQCQRDMEDCRRLLKSLQDSIGWTEETLIEMKMDRLSRVKGIRVE